MAYTLYENLGGPNDVLEKIRDFLVSKGWTILNNCTPDLDTSGLGTIDGKVLAVNKNNIYIVMRSANGNVIGSVNSFVLLSNQDKADLTLSGKKIDN